MLHAVNRVAMPCVRTDLYQGVYKRSSPLQKQRTKAELRVWGAASAGEEWAQKKNEGKRGVQASRHINKQMRNGGILI
jgi:hypothetical protein